MGSPEEEYESVMGTNPSHFNESDRPVESVNWYDAVDYCNKRSDEGLTLAYTISGTNGTTVTWNQSADGYRLPTESEWEYACRSGTSTPFNTGECVNADTEANYWGDQNPWEECPSGIYRRSTTPVRTFPATNAWGLYDMHGNVWEWVWDWYGPSYPNGSQSDPAKDPTGPETRGNDTTVGSPHRVLRGGSWTDWQPFIRSAYRRRNSPDEAWTVGFRIARNAQ